MGLDNNKDKETIKSKIGAYKTLNAEKKKEAEERRKANKNEREQKKSELTQQIEEKKKKLKKVKDKYSNQLKDLLEIYKEILPKNTGGNSLGVLSTLFLEAAENTKSRMVQILVDEMLATLGCSEEQTYNSFINVPIYIDVKTIDLYKILKKDPTDPSVKFFYEQSETPNGTSPYSMNLQLYKRLQSNVSFSQEYGNKYIGASGQQLFDLQYVTSYVNSSQQTITGDFFKVTLQAQQNANISVSQFLFDYFTSIEIFNMDTLTANIMNFLTGAFDIGNSNEEQTERMKFITFMLRIMGICTDPNKKIDVSGVAKIPELDLIDDDFFTVSNLEQRSIENQVNLITNGLVEFESCDNIKLPTNPTAVGNVLTDIISANTTKDKIDNLLKGINDISNDPNWQNSGGLSININGEMLVNVILNLPLILLQSILTPKVMLGFMVMVKAILYNVDVSFNNLTEFCLKFKKIVVNLQRKLFSIFVEELFNVIKKEIKKLVEGLLLDIINEAKNKQIAMYSTIIYVLLQLANAIIDYGNCKSVIDEVLKLLNLGLSQLNLGLPMFALAAANLLGGVSDTRAYSNVIEGLQKAGIPTDDNGDGTPNLMNASFKGMITGMNKEQAENGKTEIFIPPLTVVALGAGITKPAKGYGKSY
jgi:hypothetical protein